jgi:hypothetical protein
MSDDPFDPAHDRLCGLELAAARLTIGMHPLVRWLRW